MPHTLEREAGRQSACGAAWDALESEDLSSASTCSTVSPDGACVIVFDWDDTLLCSSVVKAHGGCVDGRASLASGDVTGRCRR